MSDAGIFAPEVLEARSEKEAAAVAAWRRNTAGLATLADLHAWLFATHLCYSVGRQVRAGLRGRTGPGCRAGRGGALSTVRDALQSGPCCHHGTLGKPSSPVSFLCPT